VGGNQLIMSNTCNTTQFWSEMECRHLHVVLGVHRYLFSVHNTDPSSTAWPCQRSAIQSHIRKDSGNGPGNYCRLARKSRATGSSNYELLFLMTISTYSTSVKQKKNTEDDSNEEDLVLKMIGGQILAS
jgi:hypothetical protein